LLVKRRVVPQTGDRNAGFRSAGKFQPMGRKFEPLLHRAQQFSAALPRQPSFSPNHALEGLK
jgi:hypothetical protein